MKTKTKQIVEAVEQLELIEEVKTLCVETILKAQLNIHLDKETFKNVLTYCKSDMDKVNKVIHYANIAGLEAVKQVIKG